MYGFLLLVCMLKYAEDLHVLALPLPLLWLFTVIIDFYSKKANKNLCSLRKAEVGLGPWGVRGEDFHIVSQIYSTHTLTTVILFLVMVHAGVPLGNDYPTGNQDRPEVPFPWGRTLIDRTSFKPQAFASLLWGRANCHPCFRDEVQRDKGPHPGPPSWKILSMHLDVSGLVSGTKSAPARQNSLQLEGESALSLGLRTFKGLSQGTSPSPTQDVSYSQGQPRVKGKQGQRWGGTRRMMSPPYFVMLWQSLKLPPWEGEEGGGELEPAAQRLPSC